MVQFTRLRLSGFKSFVDPTEVPIEPGMTGIVGPNGCGKSNLVEALRWVMGENSPKRMRGGEMDDVIFAGSVARPARNLAEVSLLLDNADRDVPARFNETEELEVIRHIERGSGSTYKVNGQEVRARDVTLLFADAATGAHSTALVSQGRVGALVNAKPKDRRSLLEEAAGITGLHSRRHEAELRLRAAETNLERLDDVISTLESQLQGLKRQARQATRYRNLAGQIRRTEASLLHLDSLAARGAVKAAEERLAAVQETVARLTEAAAAKSAEQAEAAALLPGLRQAEAAAAAKLQRLLVDRENLDREESRVAAAKLQAEQRLAQIETDRGRAQSQADDAALARQRLGEETTTLDAAATGEAEVREKAEERLDSMTALVDEQEDAVARQAEETATAEAESAALARQVAELEQRLERLRRQVEQNEAAREALEAQQREAAALRAAERDLAAAETALTEAREQAERAEGAVAAARSGEAEARDGLQAAESEEARLSAEIAALKSMLDRARPADWQPVLDLLSVDPGYEAALGAALGEDLQAASDEAAPLHWRDLPPEAVRTPLPQGVEALASHVRGPAALDRRLAQVGVVADLQAGARLQASLRTGQRLVSRDGGLWRWDGYTVRPGTPAAAATVLEHRNRLAELRPLADGAQARVAASRATLEAARATARQATEDEKAARDALRQSYARVNETREAQARLAETFAEIRSRLSALGETAQRIAAEQGETEESLREARAARAALPDLEAAKESLRALRAALADQRQELADAQAAVSQIAREAEARARRRDAIAEEQASWQRRAEEAATHLGELDTRRAEVARDLEALAEQPRIFAGKRETLAGLIEGAEQDRKTAADALAAGETRLGAADKALKDEERALGEAREERVRADAGQEQAGQDLERLVQKVQERLECGLDDLPALAELDPSQELPEREQVDNKLNRLLRERENIGPVNLRAQQEAEELETRIAGMQNERGDLVSAIARLRQGIGSLNREGRERLLAAFEHVNGHFTELFVRLFGGGRAHLSLTESDDPLEAGLEIMASPPGKKMQVLSLLSGGEQALTALSLLFAVFLTNPAPICVLDEVDAPLDDANVDRFCHLVDELADRTKTRFLVITHHRMTMARVDRLFGVTMAERGVSQLVSVDLEEAEALRDSA